ncbi:hydroxyacylglutathione hydrolase [Uliginosibacterium sediminicola]|uniref:Hydroxyacylglutathione hydrolase n=1 Tax=Uliginosibacterium sediminicola TaxID=2024550 RepID=A0ABU9YZH2_9RHOO
MKTMQIVPLSAFRDNYIWALVANGAAVVVDPGEAAPVQRFLADQALRLAAILITHRHNDHIGGVAELNADGNVPVFGPPSIACVTQPVQDADRFTLPGVAAEISVLAVPGHTEEHLAYLLGEHLFCGDTLFAGGCGRLLGSSSAAELYASLQRLAHLPPQTRVHCAHEYTLSNLRFALQVEPDNAALQARLAACSALREANQPSLPSLLADELASNPFLRVDQAAVRSAVSRYTGKVLAAPDEVFAALRRWKDVA